MPNIKEIDSLLMGVPEDIHERAWVQDAIKTLRSVAELAKGNEPVGYVDYGDRVEWYGTKPSPETDLYTIQPTASQIEQETAEACAKVYLDTYDLTDIAEAIRSGAWKEFK